MICGRRAERGDLSLRCASEGESLAPPVVTREDLLRRHAGEALTVMRELSRKRLKTGESAGTPGRRIAHLRLAAEEAPTTENGKVPPRRLPNADRRPREYLTPAEAGALIAAAGQVGRYPHRDASLLLIGYRHGLRVSELVGLEWSQVDLDAGTLHVNRLKNGSPSVHPLRGLEIRALRRLRREGPVGVFVFTTERGGPLSPSAVRKIVARAGQTAGLAFPVHPHQLRHGCGYALANVGHDTRAIAAYLGHRNLQNSARYTELAPGRFRDFWRN